MMTDIDPLNKFQCQGCGKVHVVHSLAEDCNAKHEEQEVPDE